MTPYGAARILYTTISERSQEDPYRIRSLPKSGRAGSSTVNRLTMTTHVKEAELGSELHRMIVKFCFPDDYDGLADRYGWGAPGPARKRRRRRAGRLALVKCQQCGDLTPKPVRGLCNACYRRAQRAAVAA